MKITIPERFITFQKNDLIKGVELIHLIKHLFTLEFIGGSSIWADWEDFVHYSLDGVNTGHIESMYLIESDNYSKRHVFHLTWANSGETSIVIFKEPLSSFSKNPYGI